MNKTLFVTALTVFVISACATPATPPPFPTNTPIPPTATVAGIAEFPIGLLNCVDLKGCTERYSDDRTLVVYSQGIAEVTVKWYVEGDIF